MIMRTASRIIQVALLFGWWAAAKVLMLIAAKIAYRNPVFH